MSYLKTLTKRTAVRELILWVGIITITTLLVVGVSFYQYTTLSMASSLQKQAQLTADEIVHVLAFPLYSLDDQAAANSAKAYLTSGRLYGIRLVSNASGVLIDSSMNRKSMISPIEREITYEGMPLGVMTLIMDDSEILSAQRTTLIIIFLLICGILAVYAMLLHIVFKKVLSVNLNQIIQGIHRFGDNNFDEKIRSIKYEDLNQLVLGLNTMAESIHKNQLEIIESEQQLSIALKGAKSGIWDWNIQTGKVFFDPNYFTLAGYEPNEFPYNYEEWQKRVHPDDIEIVEKQITSCVNGKIDESMVEFRFRKKNNDWMWIFSSGKICEFNGNTPIRFTGIHIDITDRKRVQEALKESEKKYRRIYDNIIDVYYEANIDGIILEISPSIEKISKYERKELIGKSLYDLYTNPEERNKLIEALINDGSVNEYELNLTDKDDTQHICSINSMLIKDKNGKPIKIVGIMRDISDRKKAEKEKMGLEEKLFRSQKMESLGLLAGGVAHDLNNVLSGIVGYPELLLLDLPEDSKFRKPIETIQESGHSAAAIVQDLLTVARGVATTKEVLNLNDLIGDYLHSPEFNKLKQFHPTTTVKTNLNTDLLNISGSNVHIRKVVMNLVLNGAEAIEGSGNVTISTVNRYVDRPLRGYDDVNIGEYAILSVSDDGSGISSDDLERIFEPFYTKKVMGRSGTGLGLAVVWNTVQDHKGYIDVTTDENGTTFELYFPITRGEISDKALSRPIKDYKGNQETILIVDDMESQQEISCKMLDKLGYKTKAVSSGEEAVEYLKENTVDLILLDMIMDPGINGRETYERIIKIHPKQKAIIVSGFAQTDEVIKAQKLGAGQYIKKPITFEKIGLAIREELEK